MIITLDIDEDGNIHCLWTDKINLFSIGRVVNVRKASNIDFNEDKQCWQVISLNGKILHENPNREKAIEWEIEAFSNGGIFYEENPLQSDVGCICPLG